MNRMNKKCMSRLLTTIAGLVVMWPVYAASSAPYQAVTPNSFASHSVAELYANTYTPANLYAQPTRHYPQAQPDTEQVKALEEQLLLSRTQALLARLNPESITNAKILAEWLTLKPQLEEIAKKRAEVEELLEVMTSLSRVAKHLE
ncbi:hypothetical protein [Thiomicrospira microaerophila]|uniref:hypothetical protein n=1 Tax=Thiomicrospira microaerophila TaxID=406020 RepID=UPI0012FDD9B8|nr:hypothetical protein [Thiomicrospira microaerophila]